MAATVGKVSERAFQTYRTCYNRTVYTSGNQWPAGQGFPTVLHAAGLHGQAHACVCTCNMALQSTWICTCMAMYMYSLHGYGHAWISACNVVPCWQIRYVLAVSSKHTRRRSYEKSGTLGKRPGPLRARREKNRSDPTNIEGPGVVCPVQADCVVGTTSLPLLDQLPRHGGGTLTVLASAM